MMSGSNEKLAKYNEKRDFRKTPEPVSQQIEEGHVTIWLEGEKISGGYALI